jgi:hypothetical protein
MFTPIEKKGKHASGDPIAPKLVAQFTVSPFSGRIRAAVTIHIDDVASKARFIRFSGFRQPPSPPGSYMDRATSKLDGAMAGWKLASSGLFLL